MFGYVTPSKSTIVSQDFVLYRAFYCGLCKSIGSQFGHFARLTTNYDITLLAILCHDIVTQDVVISEQKCICNWWKKKAVILSNQLLDRIAACNVLLTYYKLWDNKYDSKKSNPRPPKPLKKEYNKAKKILPGCDQIIDTRYNNLRALERKNCSSIDIVAHEFASMLAEVTEELVAIKLDEPLYKLAYNIGKFVYSVDAIDDIDSDAKSKNYNPFLVNGTEFVSREKFLSDNYSELEFILSTTINRAIESLNNHEFTQSTSLMNNIIYVGLREKMNQVLSSTKKLPRPRI